MSEQSQGPGWWLASDGKWYPPESVPAPPPPPLPTPLHEAQPQNGESGWWKRNWKWAVGLSIALSNAGAQMEGGGGHCWPQPPPGGRRQHSPPLGPLGGWQPLVVAPQGPGGRMTESARGSCGTTGLVGSFTSTKSRN